MKTSKTILYALWIKILKIIKLKVIKLCLGRFPDFGLLQWMPSPPKQLARGLFSGQDETEVSGLWDTKHSQGHGWCIENRIVKWIFIYTLCSQWFWEHWKPSLYLPSRRLLDPQENLTSTRQRAIQFIDISGSSGETAQPANHKLNSTVAKSYPHYVQTF